MSKKWIDPRRVEFQEAYDTFMATEKGTPEFDAAWDALLNQICYGLGISSTVLKEEKKP